MFCSKRFYLFISTIFLTVNISLGKRPIEYYFSTCRGSDPDLNKCIEKSIMEAKPNLMKGIPEINLAPLDPLYVAKYDFKEGTGNFKFVLSVSKAYISGLSGMTVEKVRFDAKKDSNITFECIIKAPKLSVYGPYSINGRVLVIPVEGKGDMSLNLTQPTLKAAFTAHTFLNTGDKKKYLAVDRFTIDLQTKSGRVLLTNLFNGDKTIGRTINNFFNDNFQDLFKALKHLPEQFAIIKIQNAINAIFNAWPYDELLPQ